MAMDSTSPPVTLSKILTLLGYTPAVSVTEAVITDLVSDARPGDAVVLDSARKIVNRGPVVGEATYFRNSTNKTAMAAYLATTALYVPIRGQSLGRFGGTYSPTLINTTQSRTGKVLIPSVGMFTNGQPWDTLKDAVDEYYTSGDVNQGSTASGAATSFLVSFGNRLYDRIYAEFGVVPPAIILVCDALEGQPIDDLAPGSTIAERTLRNMAYARSWAYANGLQIDMPFVRWIHGNADFLTKSGLRYEYRLIELQQFDTKARWDIFGQRGEVLYYVQQCASARTSVGDVSQVTMAQLNLPRRLPDKFRFLTPDTDLVHADGTHMDSFNYDIRELKHGDNVVDDLFGGGRPPFAITRGWWVNSTTVEFEGEVPVAPVAEDYTDTSATITADASTDIVTGATLISGTVVTFSNLGGALPAPLVAGVRYYARDISGNTFKVASTAGGAAINLTDAGTGTHTVYVNGTNVTFDDDSGAPPYVLGRETITVAASAATDRITATGSNLPDGRAVSFTNSGGALPSPLVAGTVYYTRDGTADDFKLCATKGGTAIDLTTAGTGTHTMAMKGIMLVDDGTRSGAGNDPTGKFIIQVAVSAAPATYGRKRFMFGMMSGPAGASPGTIGGARNVLRDSAATTAPHDRAGAANTYTLRNWMAMQEVFL